MESPLVCGSGLNQRCLRQSIDNENTTLYKTDGFMQYSTFTIDVSITASFTCARPHTSTRWHSRTHTCHDTMVTLAPDHDTEFCSVNKTYNDPSRHAAVYFLATFLQWKYYGASDVKRILFLPGTRFQICAKCAKKSFTIELGVFWHP
ncbi:hypothetical protein J6590_053900 [Homalodisca vitripennis]|nr:hypothetical protein J6590_053900 [Homalodisca vitripennis]